MQGGDAWALTCAAWQAADDARRRKREAFDDRWERFAKCDRCGHGFTLAPWQGVHPAPHYGCGGAFVITGYAPVSP